MLASGGAEDVGVAESGVVVAADGSELDLSLSSSSPCFASTLRAANRKIGRTRIAL